MDVMRPPMLAGPIERQFIFLTALSGMVPPLSEVLAGAGFFSPSSFFWRSAICFSTLAISFLMSSSSERTRPGKPSNSAASRRRAGRRPGRKEVNTGATLEGCNSERGARPG
jgi:hypothetical protein